MTRLGWRCRAENIFGSLISRVRLVSFVGVYYQHKIPKGNEQVSYCQFSNGPVLWPEVDDFFVFSCPKNICWGVTFGTYRKLPVCCINLFWCFPRTDQTSGHRTRLNGVNRSNKRSKWKVERKIGFIVKFIQFVTLWCQVREIWVILRSKIRICKLAERNLFILFWYFVLDNYLPLIVYVHKSH